MTDFRSIKAAMSFVNLGVYANPGRASPSLFSVEQNRLVYSKTSKNALLLSTGMVGSCNIVEACKSTPHPASGMVKRIILFTFEGDYERVINFLGTVFKSPAMVGPCHPSGCLSISTKKEGMNTNHSNGKFLGSLPKYGPYSLICFIVSFCQFISQEKYSLGQGVDSECASKH